MCFIEYYDGEGPTFFHEKMVKAKRAHVCEECGKPIQPGEKYELAVGKWDDEFAHFKTCGPCKEIRDKFCCSWLYGHVWLSIHEAIHEDGLNLGCLDGLSPGAIVLLSDMID